MGCHRASSPISFKEVIGPKKYPGPTFQLGLWSIIRAHAPTVYCFAWYLKCILKRLGVKEMKKIKMNKILKYDNIHNYAIATINYCIEEDCTL